MNRIRACWRCGERWKTREVPIAAFDDVEAAIRKRVKEELVEAIFGADTVCQFRANLADQKIRSAPASAETGAVLSFDWITETLERRLVCDGIVRIGDGAKFRAGPNGSIVVKRIDGSNTGTEPA